MQGVVQKGRENLVPSNNIDKNCFTEGTPYLPLFIFYFASRQIRQYTPQIGANSKDSIPCAFPVFWAISERFCISCICGIRESFCRVYGHAGGGKRQRSL